MKRWQVIVVSLLCTARASAQSDSIYVWNKWCAKKDTMLLFDKGNNIIQVYGHGFRPADITMKSLDKSLRIGTPEPVGDTLTVMAMPYGKAAGKMRLAIQDKKTHKTLRTVNFYRDTIPTLVATLGSIRTSEAPRSQVLQQTSLRIWMPGCLYSYPYTIRQFSVRVNSPKGTSVLTARGNAITPDILKEIGTAPPGTLIEFTDIKATCPECVTKDLPDIKLKLK